MIETMLPEPVVCVRCAFPMTVRLGVRRVCFQCRYSWFAHASPLAPIARAGIQPETAHVFTPDELARLRIYRLAVQARFYSDAL
jgi:hypothetical protein